MAEENDFLMMEAQILKALKTVFDPEIPVNVYDLCLFHYSIIPLFPSSPFLIFSPPLLPSALCLLPAAYLLTTYYHITKHTMRTVTAG